MAPPKVKKLAALADLVGNYVRILGPEDFRVEGVCSEAKEGLVILDGTGIVLGAGMRIQIVAPVESEGPVRGAPRRQTAEEGAATHAEAMRIAALPPALRKALDEDADDAPN